MADARVTLSEADARLILDAMGALRCFSTDDKWPRAEHAMRAALVEFDARSSAQAPVQYALFDWAYSDPKTGLQVYARTPERAEALIRDGVKLIPVYSKMSDVI